MQSGLKTVKIHKNSVTEHKQSKEDEFKTYFSDQRIEIPENEKVWQALSHIFIRR